MVILFSARTPSQEEHTVKLVLASAQHFKKSEQIEIVKSNHLCHLWTNSRCEMAKSIMLILKSGMGSHFCTMLPSACFMVQNIASLYNYCSVLHPSCRVMQCNNQLLYLILILVWQTVSALSHGLQRLVQLLHKLLDSTNSTGRD